MRLIPLNEVAKTILTIVLQATVLINNRLLIKSIDNGVFFWILPLDLQWSLMTDINIHDRQKCNGLFHFLSIHGYGSKV